MYVHKLEFFGHFYIFLTIISSSVIQTRGTQQAEDNSFMMSNNNRPGPSNSNDNGFHSKNKFSFHWRFLKKISAEHAYSGGYKMKRSSKKYVYSKEETLTGWKGRIRSESSPNTVMHSVSIDILDTEKKEVQSRCSCPVSVDVNFAFKCKHVVLLALNV